MAGAGRKRSVNLTVSTDIIEMARKLDLNVSSAAEAGLLKAISERQAELWRSENVKAIEAHNRRVEAEGVLLSAEWVDED